MAVVVSAVAVAAVAVAAVAAVAVVAVAVVVVGTSVFAVNCSNYRALVCFAVIAAYEKEDG